MKQAHQLHLGDPQSPVHASAFLGPGMLTAGIVRRLPPTPAGPYDLWPEWAKRQRVPTKSWRIERIVRAHLPRLFSTTIFVGIYPRLWQGLGCQIQWSWWTRWTVCAAEEEDNQ